MNHFQSIRRPLGLLLGASALLWPFTGCQKQGDDIPAAERRQKSGSPLVLKSEDIRWQQRPSGVKVAVLHGDPAAPGPFTLRLQYPPGYRKDPHYHPRDAYVTVLAGHYYRGYGDTFDKSKAVELVAGTFSVNPAGVSHYEWTTTTAVLQVHATGPWKTVYVDPDDRRLPTRAPVGRVPSPRVVLKEVQAKGVGHLAATEQAATESRSLRSRDR